MLVEGNKLCTPSTDRFGRRSILCTGQINTINQCTKTHPPLNGQNEQLRLSTGQSLTQAVQCLFFSLQALEGANPDIPNCVPSTMEQLQEGEALLFKIRRATSAPTHADGKVPTLKTRNAGHPGVRHRVEASLALRFFLAGKPARPTPLY